LKGGLGPPSRECITKGVGGKVGYLRKKGRYQNSNASKLQTGGKSSWAKVKDVMLCCHRENGTCDEKNDSEIIRRLG